MTATSGFNSPAIGRIARVAEALGDELRARIVFIGGAILPLLETDTPILGSPRPTKDVDGVVGTTSYMDKARVEQQMRERRFRHEIEPPAHLDRWRAPDGTTFDLVACGAHAGGTGNTHDAWAIEHASECVLPPLVRHASAIGWLLLKCGAYRDRGRKAPISSKDLSDIAALCATRPTISVEVGHAPVSVRNEIATIIRDIVTGPRTRSAIAGH